MNLTLQVEPKNWDLHTLKCRVADFQNRVRFEGGSPNIEEANLYKHLFEQRASQQTAPLRVLILGMTPELRAIALEMNCQVISADRNRDAIQLYGPWIKEEYQQRETILKADWMHLEEAIATPVDVILGDGIFGNILSYEGHLQLLHTLQKVLAKNGVMIFRQALIPTGFIPSQYKATVLLDQFRKGMLSEAEFGFSMRLWGCYQQAYQKDSYLLNNKIVFDTYQVWLNEGILLPHELDLINRYYFDGLNMILPQNKWELMLQEAGLNYKCHTLKGKSWYTYYPLYACSALNA